MVVHVHLIPLVSYVNHLNNSNIKDDGVFQLRLIDSDICQPWFKKENVSETKLNSYYKE